MLTKISNNSLSAISTLPSAIPVGALTLLSTQTASSSASISFTSGIDSTYSSYVFKFIDIHPATDGADFLFQTSTDGGSNYGITTTTTAFEAFHRESDASGLGYRTGDDLAQSTDFIKISRIVGNDNDQSCAGTLQLFNPSSDTFVKHFICRSDFYQFADYQTDGHYAGYFNTTSPVDAVQFKMSSGNIDDGIIKMYGVS